MSRSVETSVKRCAVFATALCGLALAAQGLWVPAKAVLAQVLLHRSWAATVDEASAEGAGGVHRPWPWADTWPVARLRAPGHEADLVVLHGASGEALAFGPGRLDGLGEEGPIAIAGHRDTHFAFLQDLAVGDELSLELPSEPQRIFRVSEAFRVDHRDPSALLGDADDLILITCWPLGARTSGPWRWIVRARAVG